MESRRILETQACKMVMEKMMRVLEERVTAGVSSLLNRCRFDRETKLQELGYGNTLMLLSQEDMLMLAAVSEISRGVRPLASTLLAAWLQEDYLIPRDILEWAATQALRLRNNTDIHIPSSILNNILLLSGFNTRGSSQSGTDAEQDGAQDLETTRVELPSTEDTAVLKYHRNSDGKNDHGPKETGLLESSISAHLEPEPVYSFTDWRAAVEKGDVQLMDTIKDNGVVKLKDSRGDGPLHWAAGAGSETGVSWLLGCGSDVNAKGYGERTALHCAAYHGKLSVVQLLVEGGAHINCKNMWGEYPLYLSRFYDHRSVSAYLESKGAIAE